MVDQLVEHANFSFWIDGVWVTYAFRIVAIVTALTASAIAADRFIGRHLVRIRYGLWSMTLLAVLLCPLSLFVKSNPSLEPSRKSVPHSAAARDIHKPHRTVMEQDRVVGAAKANANPNAGHNPRLTTASTFASVSNHSIEDDFPQEQHVGGGISLSSQVVRWLGIAWMIGFTISVLRLFAGMHRIQAIIRSAQSCETASLLDTLSTCCQETGIAKKPELLISGEQHFGPFVTAYPHRVIVLPDAYLQMAEETARLTILHELGHLKMLHLWQSSSTRLIDCVYWFHPLVHIVNRRLLEAMEEVVDNFVLRFSSCDRYSRMLLSVATELQPMRRLAACGMANGGNLERRIAGLLDARRDRGVDTTWRCHLLPILLLLTVGTVAAHWIPAFATAADPPGQNEADSNLDSKPSTFASAAEQLAAISIEQSKNESSSEQSVRPDLLSSLLPNTTTAFIEFDLMPTHFVGPNGEAIHRSKWMKSQLKRYLGIPYNDLSKTIQAVFDRTVEISDGQLCVARIDSVRGRAYPSRASAQIIIVARNRSNLKSDAIHQELRKHAMPASNGLRVNLMGDHLFVSYSSEASIQAINAAIHRSLRLRQRTAMKFCSNYQSGDHPCITWFRNPRILFANSSTHPLPSHFLASRTHDVLVNAFDAVECVAGVVEFPSSGKHAMTHHTLVHTPDTPMNNSRDNQGVVSLLSFPNSVPHAIPDWVPDRCTNYATVNWDHSAVAGVVDVLSGSNGFTEDFLSSLREDPNGPMLNLHPLFHESKKTIHVFELPRQDTRGVKTTTVAALAIPSELCEAICGGSFDSDPDVKRIGDLPIWKTKNGSLAVLHGHLLIAFGESDALRVLATQPDAPSLRDNEVHRKLKLDLETMLPKEHAMQFYAVEGSGILPPFRLVDDGAVQIQRSAFDEELADTIWHRAGVARVPRKESSTGIPNATSATGVVSTVNGWELSGFVNR